MKPIFNKQCLVTLLVILPAFLAASPIAHARDVGGGARGGNGARAGGGNAKHNVQANNSKRDVRTNNVRSTSVNNVNVNVNNNRRGGGWDNDYHPVATAAAVTAAVVVTSAVVGSMVRTVPAGCSPVNYSGVVYQQCGATWYQPQYVGSQVQYVVISPPY